MLQSRVPSIDVVEKLYTLDQPNGPLQIDRLQMVSDPDTSFLRCSARRLGRSLGPPSDLDGTYETDQ